jgi:hypothetical protein
MQLCSLKRSKEENRRKKLREAKLGKEARTHAKDLGSTSGPTTTKEERDRYDRGNRG